MVQSKVEGPFKDGPALYLGVDCSIRRGPQTLQAIHQSVHIYGGEIMGSHVLSTSGTINMSSASRLGLCDHIWDQLVLTWGELVLTWGGIGSLHGVTWVTDNRRSYSVKHVISM